MIAYECPICKKKTEVALPQDAPYRPFCSSRCKMLDLGRWLNEEYKISEEVSDPEQAPESGQDEESSPD